MSIRISLTLAASLVLVSCEDRASIEPSVEEKSESESESVPALEEKVAALEKRLLEEENLRFRQEIEQKEILAEMREVVHTLKEESAKRIQISPMVVPGKGAVVVKDAKDAKSPQEAREAARLGAEGEVVKHLVTRTGDEFHDLVISEVSDLGVTFHHRAGVARISFADLPSAWGQRFFYDPERALKAEKAERLAQVRREHQIAKLVRVQREEEEEAAANAQLAMLAQAVDDLRRRDDGQQFQWGSVGGGAFANPPFFLQSQFGFWDDFFCPPLYNPPVVRNSAFRNGSLVNPVFTDRPVTRTPTLTVPRLRTTNSSSRTVTRPAYQPSTPTVRPPVYRSTTGNRATSRSRTVTPSSPSRVVRPSPTSRTVTPRTSTRTVRPSSPSRSGGSGGVIRRSR